MKPNRQDQMKEAETSDGKRSSSRTELGRRILAAESAYPTDDAVGRDFAQREANRAKLLQANGEKAAPYVAPPITPDQVLLEKEKQDGFRSAIEWLERECRNDVPLRLILVASRSEDIDASVFKSSVRLAETCGLSYQQVKAAKDRLRYLVKKVGATNLNEFIDIVSKESKR